MTRTRWTPIYLSLVALMAALLLALVWVVPVTEEGAREWTAPLIPGGWMAWTFPIALFFWIIASLLITMTLLAIRFPETPRIGILRIETTRGDRLFITLLGSAFIHLAWLFFFGTLGWAPMLVCLAYAALVFWLV
jgi:predicted small integral membrane protein